MRRSAVTTTDQLCSDEHKLLCKEYADLPLRPTIDDRLHLFFPEDEDKPRFVWISDVRCVDRLIDPKQRCVERSNMISQVSEEFVRIETLLDDYRDVRATHTRAYAHVSYVNPNRSLGMPITGRPLRAMKGHLLLSATVRVEGHK
jgi:hypothetical protein